MDELDSKAREHVCALVDGRLPEGELAQILNALLADPQSVQTWHAYHVVGDVLRSPELAPGRSDLAFLERLERRLAEEPERPGIVATHSTAWNSKEIAPVMVDMGTPVANAPVFRWKMLAGVASTALFGVLALNLWTEVNPKPDTQMSALNKDAQPLPPVVVADTRAGSMIRDPRLDELMAAHRQLGGHSALQVPAGFLRNATYEGPAR
jgi:sigma-E factor negative regulatory protein RseA